MSEFIIKRLPLRLPKTDVDALVEFTIRAFANAAHINDLVGGDQSLKDLYFRSLIGAANVGGGEIYGAVEADTGKVVSLAAWAPPGKMLVESPEEREQGQNELESKLSREAKEWREKVLGKGLEAFLKEIMTVKSVKDSWSISLVATDPDYQNRGLASRVIQTMLGKHKGSKDLAAISCAEDHLEVSGDLDVAQELLPLATTSAFKVQMGVFDLKDQLVFYGQYHSNKYNVAVHMCFVPLILWTSLVIFASIPVPQFFPSEPLLYISPYAYLQWTWAVPSTVITVVYYFMLDPLAAITYMPILSTMVLTASPIAQTPSGVKAAIGLFVLSWIAQIAAHEIAEKRSPALLDNLAGALILAPFFVHFELLFALGYRPQLHKEITNGIGIEISKYRRETAERKRQAQKKE